MKKSIFILCAILILSLSLFAGCGKEGDDSQLPSISLPNSLNQSIDNSDSASLPNSASLPSSATRVDSEMKSAMELLSTQFYQDEVMEITRIKKNNGNVVSSQDIYLCDEDGKSRLIVQDAPAEYGGKWYYTEEGYCLAIWKNTVIRIEPDGTETFNEIIESGVSDLCQLSDGRIMMMMTDVAGNVKLAELNPETGEFTKFDSVELTKDRRQYIAAGEDGLLLMTSAGLWEVNLETGELTVAESWDNYDYSLGFTVEDYKLYGNGILEIVQNEKKDTLLPKNVSESRTVIVMRDVNESSALTSFVEEFNKVNANYYIERHYLEDESKWEDYYADTESALIDGQGADIVLTNAVASMYDLMQKGLFEDLIPYMEASDMYKEDYFPGTFRYQNGEKYYGIQYSASASTGLIISKKLLGEEREPDIEFLVDALLNYTGEEVLVSHWGSESVLDYFLSGSEDLWGMIDWENGTCDFNGVLFAKMLETAKLYGNGGKSDLPALAEISGTAFYSYDSQALLNEKNMVRVGYICDDGCYEAASVFSVMIGSNSENKEGAWEFLRFLLSEKVQSSMLRSSATPVHRAAYATAVEREMEEGSLVHEKKYGGGTRTTFKAGAIGNMTEEEYKKIHDLTQEKADEIKGILENVKFLPIRTEEIINIILEEAAAYFDDTAFSADVCANIQSRVQQYLDENK